MVWVDIGIPACFEHDAYSAMLGKLGEHVVQERQGAFKSRAPISVQVQFDGNLRFERLPIHAGPSFSHLFETSA
jgi:hypothetical protein